MTAATRPAPLDTAAPPPAQIAKLALRRLAQGQIEPTPENFARAYDEELGVAPRPVLPGRALPGIERLLALAIVDEAQRGLLLEAFAQGRWQRFDEGLAQGSARASAESQAHGNALATMLERLVRGLEQSGRQWTAARKKDSLQRVLDGSRSDAQRLQQRLSQLIASWDGDSADSAVGDEAEPEAPRAPEAVQAQASAASHASPAAALPAVAASDWRDVIGELERTVGSALPGDDARAAALAAELKRLADALVAKGPDTGLVEALATECENARRMLQHRHHLLASMRTLCGSLTDGLTDLAEDDSWARGQAEAMRARLSDDFSARGVRAADELLRSTRERQHQLRSERAEARQGLKAMIQQMLHELGELGNQTGRFQGNVERYAEVIEQADSLESLAGAVREMVAETRTVHGLVSQAQQRLHDEHERASVLSERVSSLEGELRRLSDEVSTDPLTQIANRRGLMQTFEAERARLERQEGGQIALALLDVDNFKRLNDELGHAAGDAALKSLAERVKQALRPTDSVARYGGEEFVVVLPNTPIDEAQQIMARLQRALTAALFMHENRQVFVTFSAGLTLYRGGETLEAALDRADEALYEAKRTGKNRCCLG